ncbi:hypothetical protein CLV31_101364 [Algoriphagus aquaeductus]|uniref:Uncharacterized protein n=2 Tax=Algoriphagus aquaeductus TaxID=475299 RepID=A0A326S1M6_9BACT|nr:hypothetical protein CLV31_101364 [Algoriphagus aquaeductus]
MVGFVFSSKFLTMNTLFEFLSKGKNLFLLALIFIGFNLLLTHFMPKEYALDLKFAYTVEEAYLSLGHLDQGQRDLYRLGVWSLDMPYMLVYTLFFMGVLSRIWNSWKYSWLPIAISLMDFFENILILRILKIYPSQDVTLVRFASFFSTSKWLLVGVLLVFGVVGLGYWLVQRGYSQANSTEARL